MEETIPRHGTRRLAVAGMVRNEIDIIRPFLRQCLALFDRAYLIDVQSTDGTRAAIEGMDGGADRIALFRTDRQERFQGPMMDALSRRAFADGADWVFLLDADEFIDVESRAALEAYLAGFNADVMHLRWINMVPTVYGEFGAFDCAQPFHWSGRASAYQKVAISHLFASRHPEYFIHEGNHHVSVRRDRKEVAPRYGLPLLHVPIRSAARLKYKNSGALLVTSGKHNRLDGEGAHIERLDRLLSANVGAEELNYLAAHYSERLDQRQLLDPARLAWPTKHLPPFVRSGSGPETAPADSLGDVLQRDRALVWDRMPFAPHSIVAATIDGSMVKVRPQPISGVSRLRAPRFAPLDARPADPRGEAAMLADAVQQACRQAELITKSERSSLVPALFAAMAATRPRRVVELGTSDGSSFFALCQAEAELACGAECVAVDPWIGPVNDGPQSEPVFEAFKWHLGQTYPDQLFIQTPPESALTCFEDGSIDLLHLAGHSRHEAAQDAFERWLPKLSDRGVVLLSGTAVRDRDHDVWRFWDDVATRFPSCHLPHGIGLGVLATGAAPSPLQALLRRVAADPESAALLQSFFGSVTQQATALNSLELERRRLQTAREQDQAMARAQADGLHTSIEEQRLELELRQQKLDLKSGELDTVLGSTAWRVTSPLRTAMGMVRRGRPDG